MNINAVTIPNNTITLSRMSSSALNKSMDNIFDKSSEWDICYKYAYPYNVLCNFTPSHYFFDDIEINSMEGFLQSLKVKDPEEQKGICQLPGFFAKKLGNYYKRNNIFDGQHIYWQGKEYDRYSKNYQQLLNRAYSSKYNQDSEFRNVLKASKGYRLTHKIGKADPQDTILTEEEFITHLETLRQPHYSQNIAKLICARIKNNITIPHNVQTITKKLLPLKTSFINSNIICGESLFEDKKNINKAKKAGISNIIDITSSQETAEERQALCKEHGLDYLSYSQAVDISNQDLIKLIHMLNQNKKTYICCKNKSDTNGVLALNYLFNPNAKIYNALLFGTPKKKLISRLVNSVLKQITPETIEKLGWTDNFADEINKREKTLIEINE